MAVLCTLLTTSACAHQTKKAMTASSSSSEPQTAAQAVVTPAHNGPLRLHEVRVIESTGQHSVLFRLSRPPEGVDYFPLRNPSRLVIDIKGSTIESLPKVQRYKASDPLVSAVRIGSYQGRMRFVIDLKGAEVPPFSVDNYETLITAFIGEKTEKQQGKEQAESSAQVLFLADEVKEERTTQLASAPQKSSSSLATAEEKKLEPAPGSPSMSLLHKGDDSTVSKEESVKGAATLNTPLAASQPPHKTTEPTAPPMEPTQIVSAKSPAQPKPLQEETLSPSAPARFEANQAEEEPWDVEQVSQAPASATGKGRRTGRKRAEEAFPVTVAREESAPPAAEFRPEQEKLYTGRKISLDFKNADIHDVLRIIAEVSGLNIVATDDVKARVTLRLVEVPWDQALDVVLQANGLEKTRIGNVITVSTTKRLEAERNARLAAQNAQQKVTPLATEYVKVNYVKATEVAALVTREAQQRAGGAGAGPAAPPRPTPAPGGAAGGGGRLQQVALLSPRGTIAADPTTNVIIIRDLPENIAALREMIKNIDVQTPQVVIESQIVTVDVTAIRDLGIQWGYSYRASPETGNPTGVNFPGRVSLGPLGGNFPFIADFPASLKLGNASALDLNLGSLSGSQSLDMRLSALETEGRARVISRPHVVTLNNKTATIQSLTEVRVPITAGSLNIVGAGGAAGGAGAFEQFDVGLTLKVTPQISSDGFVLLDIEVKNSELTGTSSAPPSGPSATPIINDVLSRSATSNVLIRASDTFVLGGIRQDQLIQGERGIPYLRDTPVLGWLFRGRTSTSTRRELLVFLTPKLVAGISTTGMPTAQQLWENRAKGRTAEAVVQQ
ncbi:MAG TPA: type IV pilus secretin PilQ [Methylomirabilota bacterium]|nr:type IV pilus secretin PilQ [Methylomirabilota bacterium]